MRRDGRKKDELREVNIITDYMPYAEGSCLMEMGNTRVICTASVEEGVPPFLRGQGTGWITSEYSLLPRSCKKRVSREASRGKQSGRTHEIQRLIGRSMRSVADLSVLGERTVWIDCDVVQADGGTRCASITGSFVALALALGKLRKEEILGVSPLGKHVAAVSVGVVGGESCLDLDYAEDSSAEVDMNIVMTGSGEYIEVQGTAEKEPFSKNSMNELLFLAEKGIGELVERQKAALKGRI
ncbi:MAG: ribonuclease PH [Candidatus Omnitrophica bacterium]|nr:ribonuclease PH [Candidatus Omnitrophota bacterium]